MKRKYYDLPLSNITAKIESTVHPMKTNDEINEIFTDFAFDVYGSIIPEDQPNLVKARQKILDLKDKWERDAHIDELTKHSALDDISGGDLVFKSSDLRRLSRLHKADRITELTKENK